MTHASSGGRAAGAAAVTAAACALAGCLLTGCVASSGAMSGSRSAAGGVPVVVSRAACGTGWRHPAAGPVTFQVRNASTAPVDVSLTDADTTGVYAQLTALAPGTTRPLRVTVGSGSYAFQCDSTGYGPRTGPVTRVPGHVPGDQAIVPPTVEETDTAVAGETRYVSRGLAAVASQTETLASDLSRGDLSGARGAWLTAHLSFERLGSAYGMFGDYDNEIAGTPFGLRGGASSPSFTGFYRIEYGLWHGQSAAALQGPARQLHASVTALQTAWPGMVGYPQSALSDLARRTHEILEDSIRFQLSGADDFGSGTTLATTAANIDAVQAQLAMLRPMLISRYPQLSAASMWLGRLRSLIDAQHRGGRWTPASAVPSSAREAINSAAAETVQLLAPVATLFEASPLP